MLQDLNNGRVRHSNRLFFMSDDIAKLQLNSQLHLHSISTLSQFNSSKR